MRSFTLMFAVRSPERRVKPREGSLDGGHDDLFLLRVDITTAV